MVTVYSNGGSSITTLQSIPMAGICVSWHWFVAMLCITAGPLSHSISVVGYTALGAWQRIRQSLCLPYMMGRGLFSCFTPPMDTMNSESVVDIKPGYSSVVIGYQVHECASIWTEEHFVA